MNALVIKIMAVGLTLSQLFTAPPEEFQAHLDPQDTQKVAEILHRGCKFIIKNEFDDQTEGLEFLLETIVKNVERIKKLNEGKTEKETHSFTMRVIEQIDFPALQAAYRRFCRQDQEAQFDLAPVIEFYNSAFKDLEDPNKLKNLRLQGATYILDSEGQRFSEVYADNNRRRWIPIRSIPKFVQQAFVAAEDKTFYNHKGVDLAGIVRAFRNNLTSPQSRPQGGSTITQQVVKNILVGDDLTFERKMREMVLAAQVERILSKEQILELYLNYVFLGRASWGVEMAAQSYFGKSIRSVNFSEAALLAGLTKGPNYYHPDRFPDRAKERRTYVLNRLFEDFTDEEKQKHKSAIDSAKQSQVALEKFTPPRTRGAFYYLDAIQKSAKSVAGIQSLTEHSYVVRSTMHRTTYECCWHSITD